MNSTVHTHTPTHAQWLSFTSAVIHRLQWLETWWIFIDYPDYCELSSVCICRASCLKTVIHFLQSVNSSAPVRRPDANVLTMCLSYLVCWSAQLRSLMLVKSYLDVHKTHTHTQSRSSIMKSTHWTLTALALYTLHLNWRYLRY